MNQTLHIRFSTMLYHRMVLFILYIGLLSDLLYILFVNHGLSIPSLVYLHIETGKDVVLAKRPNILV